MADGSPKSYSLPTPPSTFDNNKSFDNYTVLTPISDGSRVSHGIREGLPRKTFSASKAEVRLPIHLPPLVCDPPPSPRHRSRSFAAAKERRALHLWRLW